MDVAPARRSADFRPSRKGVPGWARAASIAVAALALPSAASAEEASPLANYVQARAAASAGAVEQASAAFAAILASEPDNELVAAQALSHAVAAGDWDLALAAPGRWSGATRFSPTSGSCFSPTRSGAATGPGQISRSA